MTGWLWVSAWAVPPSDDWRPTTPYGHGFVVSGWDSRAFDRCLLDPAAVGSPAPADGDEHLFVRQGGRVVDAVVGRGVNVSAETEPRWVSWDPCFADALAPVFGAERVTLHVALGPVPAEAPIASWRWAGQGHGWVPLRGIESLTQAFATCLGEDPGDLPGKNAVTMELPAVGPVLDLVVDRPGSTRIAAVVVGRVIGPSDGHLRFGRCADPVRPALESAPVAPPAN